MLIEINKKGKTEKSTNMKTKLHTSGKSMSEKKKSKIISKQMKMEIF